MMNEINPKKVLFIFLSILAGIASSILIFFVLILFFLATGLFGWSDGGEPEFLRRPEIDSAEVENFIKTDTAVITGRLVMKYYPLWTAKGKFIFK